MARIANRNSGRKRRRIEDRKPVKRVAGWRDVPDHFWERLAPLIPENARSPKGGRPGVPHRKVFDGILYVLRTGCQWKMMPREYGSGSVAHSHFQAWCRNGVFAKLWALCLEEYDELRGIDWDWQTVDSATVSSPVKGGIAPGRTRPTAANSGPSAISKPTAAGSP